MTELNKLKVIMLQKKLLDQNESGRKTREEKEDEEKGTKKQKKNLINSEGRL